MEGDPLPVVVGLYVWGEGGEGRFDDTSPSLCAPISHISALPAPILPLLPPLPLARRHYMLMYRLSSPASPARRYYMLMYRLAKQGNAWAQKEYDVMLKRMEK